MAPSRSWAYDLLSACTGTRKHAAELAPRAAHRWWPGCHFSYRAPWLLGLRSAQWGKTDQAEQLLARLRHVVDIDDTTSPRGHTVVSNGAHRHEEP